MFEPLKSLEKHLGEFDFNSRVPYYNDDSDYTTNAPSYYDDLARKNKLIKHLAMRIWDYDEEMLKRLEQWDKNLEEFDDEVLKLLQEWMDNGTFDEIINEHIFGELNDKVNNNSEILKTKPTKIDSDLTVTVGLNGDFDSINNALTYLTGYHNQHVKDGLKAEILILSNTVISEQVHVKSDNLSWITISSEDNIVQYDRGAMVKEDPDGYVSKSAFLGYMGGSLPSINVLFNIIENGTPEQKRFFQVRGGGSLYIHSEKGVIGKCERNLVVSHGSSVTARFSIIKNAHEINLRISNGGTFNGEYGDYSGSDLVNVAIACATAGIDYSDCSNAEYDGVRVTTGPAMVSANGVDASGCNRYGLQVWAGAIVNFTGSNVNDSGTHGIYLQETGMIAAQKTTINNVKGIAVYVIGTGTIDLRESQINNCESVSVYCSGTVSVDITDAQINNGIGTGVVATMGARVNGENSNITGGEGYSISIVESSNGNFKGATLKKPSGVTVQHGGVANLSNADCRRGVEDVNSDIVIDNGGTVNATGAIGGMIISPNIVQPRGVIFKRDV